MLITQIDTLRSVIKKVRRHHPFFIKAIVVLPDHLHMIMALPKDDHDFSKRWSLKKGYFSHQIPKNERISIARKNKRERGIWQRRFWEHLSGPH